MKKMTMILAALAFMIPAISVSAESLHPEHPATVTVSESGSQAGDISVTGQNSNNGYDITVPEKLVPVKLTGVSESLVDENYLFAEAQTAMNNLANENPKGPLKNKANDTNAMGKGEETDLYNKGLTEARELYTGHQSAGISTLVGSSLALPMGVIIAADQSAQSKSENFVEIANPQLRTNPAYMKGFTDEAQRMKRKSIRKNLLVGIAVQAVIATAVGTAMSNSGNMRIGMSGL